MDSYGNDKVGANEENAMTAELRGRQQWDDGKIGIGNNGTAGLQSTAARRVVGWLVSTWLAGHRSPSREM
jgi:hypothetical protein